MSIGQEMRDDELLNGLIEAPKQHLQQLTGLARELAMQLRFASGRPRLEDYQARFEANLGNEVSNLHDDVLRARGQIATKPEYLDSARREDVADLYRELQARGGQDSELAACAEQLAHNVEEKWGISIDSITGSRTLPSAVPAFGPWEELKAANWADMDPRDTDEYFELLAHSPLSGAEKKALTQQFEERYETEYGVGAEHYAHATPAQMVAAGQARAAGNHGKETLIQVQAERLYWEEELSEHLALTRAGGDSGLDEAAARKRITNLDQAIAKARLETQETQALAGQEWGTVKRDRKISEQAAPGSNEQTQSLGSAERQEQAAIEFENRHAQAHWAQEAAEAAKTAAAANARPVSEATGQTGRRGLGQQTRRTRTPRQKTQSKSR